MLNIPSYYTNRMVDDFYTPIQVTTNDTANLQHGNYPEYDMEYECNNCYEFNVIQCCNEDNSKWCYKRYP
jgi:hypothetical protein